MGNAEVLHIRDVPGIGGVEIAYRRGVVARPAKSTRTIAGTDLAAVLAIHSLLTVVLLCGVHSTVSETCRNIRRN